MLRSIRELKGYKLDARDGEIGHCKDFLFDDQEWTVRYMVADTGKWISDRKVLISPISLGDPDWGSERFPVNLRKEQVENAPPLSADEPVSRQHEVTMFGYYGYPHYWIGSALWGPEATPAELIARVEDANRAPQRRAKGDPHLRSVNEVTGYHIATSDGEIGHVEDFILDDKTWSLRYMVVDTRNWLPGRKVLVSPFWVEDLDWGEEKAVVGLAREQIRNGPKYDPGTPVNREYEGRLFDFYGRPVYWE
jgi:sporulation protein YlmC with PRC-barrel domain